jgi:outer membrane murein-binding lipoprotein Lpp
MSIVIVILLVLLLASAFSANLKLYLIMATQADLVTQLNQVSSDLDTVAQKITDLQNSNGAVTPELQAAVDAVVSKVAAVNGQFPAKA